MSSIRPPAVAGTFYPGNKVELQKAVAGYLGQPEKPGQRPKGLVVPHAGYIFSGPVAGKAYARLLPFASEIRTVVLLGPAHRVPVYGLGTSTADGFQTPLGVVKTDKALLKLLQGMDQVEEADQAHAVEHSLEVQLPFLQTVLPDFKLIPLVVGEASAEAVATVLAKLWGGPETLIVISTDLSHYLPYDSAVSTDKRTGSAVERMSPQDIHDGQACGAFPLRGFLKLAKEKGLKARTLMLCNSGDTAGPKNEVVGYGAWEFIAS